MAVIDNQREEVRNRLLRRVDWRFLLPQPAPKKTVCFAEGLLADAVPLISQHMVDPRRAQHSECELAVAVNPDPGVLRAAWSALQPGGACYTEWYSPLSGGVRMARQRLACAGFEDITCYWCWPWPSRASAQFWLPLESPSALHHFLGGRAAARNGLAAVGSAILRMVWMLALRLGLLLPICAIARKPATLAQEPAAAPESADAQDLPAATAAPAELSALIRDGWQQWGFGRSPERLAWILLTGGRRSINKVVGLVSDQRDGRPCIVVKLPRVLESVPALRKEAATLQAIHSLHAGGLRGVPQVVFCREHDGLLALGETALAGMPLWSQLQRATYHQLALKATDWLIALAGRPQPCPPAHWRNRLVVPVLNDFNCNFGSIADRGLIRETEAILATLPPLPIVCEQRDFSPWNVLIDANGELAVLDWESAELHGLPALDLSYFLTYLAFFHERALETGRIREAYRAALDPTTFTGSVQRECLGRYIAGTGLDPAALHPLRLLAWLLHARSEYQHFSADTLERPDPAKLRQSVFVTLWEEELRHGGSS